MPSPSSQPTDQEYPALPASTEPPHKEVAQATSISFVFPGKRIFNRPWSRLVGAGVIFAEGIPVLIFNFADLEAKVIFVGENKDEYQSYWQSYIDGKLTTIEDKSGEIQIVAKYVNLSEKFQLLFPKELAGGGATYAALEESGTETSEGEEGGGGGSSDEEGDGF